MLVAPKVWNLRSEFGHAIGLRVLEIFAVYASIRPTDRPTDGRTKAKLTSPSLRAGHNNKSVHFDETVDIIMPLLA